MSEQSPSESPPRRHDYMNESWVPKIKRRRRFSTEETKILEKEYDRNSSPNQEKIQEIANAISTPRKIVTTWFQNRRAKNKRKERAKVGSNSDRSLGSRRIMYRDGDGDETYRDESVSESNDDYIPVVNIPFAADCYDYISGSSQTSQYTMQQQSELPSYANTLTTSPNTTINCYNTRSHPPEIFTTSPPPIVDTNQQYTFLQNNQYFTLPQNNQQYSINIYNNMNNYLHLQQQYETNHSSPRDNMSNRNVYDMNPWQEYFYWQPYQTDPSLFGDMNSRNFCPFATDTMLSALNNESTQQFCINPTDIYLNQRSQKESEDQ